MASCLISAAGAQVLGAQIEAQRPLTRRANYSMAQQRMPDGAQVREYVTPAGRVFGISWRGPRVPDLKHMLGPRFERFKAAAALAARRRRGPLYVHVGTLVVENGGHMRDFRGRAYLTDALPAGVSPAVIQ